MSRLPRRQGDSKRTQRLHLRCCACAAAPPKDRSGCTQWVHLRCCACSAPPKERSGCTCVAALALLLLHLSSFLELVHLSTAPTYAGSISTAPTYAGSISKVPCHLCLCRSSSLSGRTLATSRAMRELVGSVGLSAPLVRSHRSSMPTCGAGSRSWSSSASPTSCGSAVERLSALRRSCLAASLVDVSTGRVTKAW